MLLRLFRLRRWLQQTVQQKRFLSPRLVQVGQALGIVWALPLSLLCSPVLLLAFSQDARLQLVRAPTPALLLSSRGSDWLLEKHPFGPMSGMALGHVVVIQRHHFSQRLLTHELAHVRQAAWWGPLFPLAYAAASLWAGLRGRDLYWNNVFEEAARRAEKERP